MENTDVIQNDMQLREVFCLVGTLYPLHLFLIQ